MSNNNKHNFSNIHIIPFDMGFMFYDVYTPSYPGNYYLWQEFAKKLQELVEPKSQEVLSKEPKLSIKEVVCKGVSQELGHEFKVIKRCKKQTVAIFPVIENKDKPSNKECFFEPIVGDNKNYLNTFDECLCEIKLQENLYCYILKSGIAVFVVGCFNGEGLESFTKNSETCDNAIKMRFQNEILNRAVLLDELNPQYSTFLSYVHDTTGIFDPESLEPQPDLKTLIKKDNELKIGCENLDEVIKEQRNTMNLFKIWCWKTVQDLAKKINDNNYLKKAWENKRPHSSKPYFKQFGFSMSTSFIISKDFEDSKKINYLQDRSLSYQNFDDLEFWQSSNKYYERLKYINIPKSQINSLSNDDTINVPPLNIVKMSDFNISFSPNTICVQPKQDKQIKSLDDFLKNSELTDLLFAEIDVITKWFNADNCINNNFEKPMSGVEDLQTIQGQIEYYSAELANPTSSKVESLYLMYKRRIVETTKIKELYDSISKEIKILKAKKIEKINEAAEARQKSSRRAATIVDCFIAGVAAAGTVKTIIDLFRGSYAWWDILILFVAIIILIGFRIALHRHDNKMDKKKQEDIKKR